MPTTNEFSVYWWDPEGGQHRELSFVELMTAMKAVARLTQGPGSKFAVRRVIITDGGDSTVFEWFQDKGITWPKERAGWR